MLKVEERLGYDVRDRRATAATWGALACVRARLELADGKGRMGPEMALGDPWNTGAIKAALRAVEREPTSPAAELLGILALEEYPEHLPAPTYPVLLRSVDAGSRQPGVLRACAQLALGQGEATTARRCIRIALTAGVDSTFHLLLLSRIAHRAGDQGSAENAFLMAANAVRGPADREQMEWHLRWFLEPSEVEQWNALPDSATGPWVQDRLAARDIRDGRAPGSRVQEHLRRWEYALVHFRLRLQREARKAGGLVGVAADLPIDQQQWEPDSVRATCEPGTIPARPTRFYQRWQTLLDDRGAVYMRFGEPEQRISLIPECVKARSFGTLPPAMKASVREAWRYTIDGAPLLLNFESERFDGSSEATRLVAGVLGSYLCGIDTYRCLLTQRSIAADLAGNPEIGVPAENVIRVRDQDIEQITVGTTKDDNSERGGRPLAVNASLFRLWDGSRAAPISLVTWAVRLGDLAKDRSGAASPIPLAVSIRRWSASTSEWHDTTLTSRVTLPTPWEPTQYATGTISLPGGEAVTAWSLVASTTDSARGRVWQDGLREVGYGEFLLSDVVLGSPSQGSQWTIGGERVALAPLGGVSRAQSVNLYYQVVSADVREGLTTSIAFRRITAGKAEEQAALEVGFETRVRAGVNGIVRELDLSRLDRGSYRLDVVIRSANEILAMRSTPLLLR
jgi:hypothetical protein